MGGKLPLFSKDGKMLDHSLEDSDRAEKKLSRVCPTFHGMVINRHQISSVP